MDNEIRKGMEVELMAIQDQFTELDRSSEEYARLSKAYVEQLEKLQQFEKMEDERVKTLSQDTQKSDEKALKERELEIREDELKHSKKKHIVDKSIEIGTQVLLAVGLLWCWKDSWDKERGEEPLMQTTNVGKDIQRRTLRFFNPFK